MLAYELMWDVILDHILWQSSISPEIFKLSKQLWVPVKDIFMIFLEVNIMLIHVYTHNKYTDHNMQTSCPSIIGTF